MGKWQRALYQPNLPLGRNGERVTACKEHIQLSKEAAKEGMVLLKNNENILPFAPGTKLALFGKGSFDYVKGGGGRLGERDGGQCGDLCDEQPQAHCQGIVFRSRRR